MEKNRVEFSWWSVMGGRKALWTSYFLSSEAGNR